MNQTSAPSYLLELLWCAVTQNGLDASGLARGTTALGMDETALDSVLVDVLWLVSLQVEHDDAKRQVLVEVTKQLVDTHRVVSKNTLLERCEGEFLEECGFVVSAVSFRKKEIRVNTRVVYQQKKFNLLREESEGYAKLIAVLQAFATRPGTSSGSIETSEKKTSEKDTAADEVAASNTKRAVQSLIGTFDLCPNRALDLVMDAAESLFYGTNRDGAESDESRGFETVARNVAGFKPLFQLFRDENIGQVLGFKFQNHHAETERAKASARTTVLWNAARRRRRERRKSFREPKMDYGDIGDDNDSDDEDSDAEDSDTEAGEVAYDAAKAVTAVSLEPTAEDKALAEKAASEAAAKHKTPESLYLLAAALVAIGMVALDDLYAHVSPSDDSMVESRASAVRIRIAAAKKIGVINLLAAAPPPDDDDDETNEEGSFGSLGGGAGGGAPKNEKKQPTPEPDPFAIASTPDNTSENQKFGLLKGLLAIRDTPNSNAMLARLVSLGLDPAEDHSVSNYLRDRFSKLADESYGPVAPPGCGAAKRTARERKENGAKDTAGDAPGSACDQTAPDANILPSAFFESLDACGPYVARSPGAFARVRNFPTQHIPPSRLPILVPEGTSYLF